MKTLIHTERRRSKCSATKKDTKQPAGAFQELERGVRAALETYSNVHRGSGHYSLITTELYEQARVIILEHLGLDKAEYTVIFCTPQQAETFMCCLAPSNYRVVSSRQIGLPIGSRAIAVKKNALPKGTPSQTGGSVVKLVSPDSVIWADAPQRFEAGTPGIINAITLAIALSIMKKLTIDNFRSHGEPAFSISDVFYNDVLSEYSGEQLLYMLRKQLVGYAHTVPTTEGETPFINLDNAASTPTFYPIWDTVCKVLQQPEDNYSEIIQETKNIVANFLGASQEKYDVIFTGNTTEALNLSAQFIHSKYKDNSDLVVLNTIMEHNSNELPWRYIPGASLVRLPVDDDGFVDLDDLERILKAYNEKCIYGKKRIRIVAISGASNVLGTFNDLHSISRTVHKYGAEILVDGAQLAAHRGVNMAEVDIDQFVFSGHKVYAPFGTGALIIKKDQVIDISSADIKNIKNSGEENIAGIAALGKAILLLKRIGIDVIEEKERGLTDLLLKGLSEIKEIEVFGIRDPGSKDIHNRGAVVSFSLKNVPHNLAAKELAEQGGIGVRTGCFCTHLLMKQILKINPAVVFGSKIGFTLFPRLTRLFLPGIVRVSLGIENSINDVEMLIKALKKMGDPNRSIINRLLAINRNGTPFLAKTMVQERIKNYIKIRVEKVYNLHNKKQTQYRKEVKK